MKKAPSLPTRNFGVAQLPRSPLWLIAQYVVRRPPEILLNQQATILEGHHGFENHDVDVALGRVTKEIGHPSLKKDECGTL